MKIVRKLIISVLTLICVAACFTASTYAWFIVASSAQVGGFQFSAHGGEGFLVSVDGVNYSNDLTEDQMKMAMVAGYDPSRYQIENNKLYDKMAGSNVSMPEVNKILLENIQLHPLTSSDGINFSNKIGTSITNTSGKYIEFNIYFKATSNVAEDKFSYDIYLCGEDITQMNGTVITKTSIESISVNTISLLDDMVLYDGSETGLMIGPEKSQNYVNVYTSNALRFSIQDVTKETGSVPGEDDSNTPTTTVPTTEPVEPTPTTTISLASDDETEEELKPATIYELTNEYDLGSYATDYNGDDADLNKLYNSKFNAMFTYYNNLRPYSQLTAMSYENMPQTVRSLSEEHVITNVTSGSNAKCITFRFWLEGWDADCFDGLSESINVKLLFNSTKVDIE